MTREEWEASEDPVAMLGFLTSQKKQPTNIQAKNFVVACRTAADPHHDPYRGWSSDLDDLGQLLAGWGDSTVDPYEEACPASLRAHFIREVVGNPWLDTSQWPQGKCPECGGDGRESRAEVPWAFPACKACQGTGKSLLTGPWLTWDGGVVATLARTIYDRKAWDELPILADALQEAGCQVAELLDHLRGKERCQECDGAGHLEPYNRCGFCGSTGLVVLRGPHVLGCWALDLLLGKS